MICFFLAFLGQGTTTQGTCTAACDAKFSMRDAMMQMNALRHRPPPASPPKPSPPPPAPPLPPPLLPPLSPPRSPPPLYPCELPGCGVYFLRHEAANLNPSNTTAVAGAGCSNLGAAVDDDAAAMACRQYCLDNANEPADCRWMWVYVASNGRCCPMSYAELDAWYSISYGGGGFFYSIKPSPPPPAPPLPPPLLPPLSPPRSPPPLYPCELPGCGVYFLRQEAANLHPSVATNVAGAGCSSLGAAVDDDAAVMACRQYCLDNANEPADCRWMWVYVASNGRCCPKSYAELDAWYSISNEGGGFFYSII